MLTEQPLTGFIMRQVYSLPGLWIWFRFTFLSQPSLSLMATVLDEHLPPGSPICKEIRKHNKNISNFSGYYYFSLFLPSHPFLIACSFVAETVCARCRTARLQGLVLWLGWSSATAGDWVPLLPSPPRCNGINHQQISSIRGFTDFLQTFSVYGHAKSSCVKYKLIEAVF